MVKNEFDIRLAEVNEQPSRSHFNRWEIMRYDGYPISVKISTNFLPYIENNILKVVLGVHYDTSRNHSPRNLLQYYISLNFEILNLSEYIEITDKIVKLPSYMLTVIMSVSIGTLRGMLVQRTRHTFLDTYPLPILNISEIVADINSPSSSYNSASPIFQFVYE